MAYPNQGASHASRVSSWRPGSISGSGVGSWALSNTRTSST